MILEIHRPSAPLDAFVSHFLYYEGFEPVHRIDRFLPDGNTEMIIELTGAPQYIYDNATLAEKQACRNGWVSGVRTEFISIPSGRESRMFVVAFKKGKTFPFYGLPLSEMTDIVTDADLLFGGRFASFRERLLNSASVSEMFAHAENFLTEAAGGAPEMSIGARCTEYAVASILKNPDMVNFASLSNIIGYSQKHFISIFKKYVGVAPKTYLRIIRFQKAIAEMEKSGNIHWSALAADSGFYDQAHFIHDFRRFSGFTPSEYLSKKNGELNYVPVA